MKKKLTLIFTIMLAALFLFGCKDKDGSSEEGDKFNFDKDSSYAMGMTFGMNFAEDGVIPDVNAFRDGLRDGLSGNMRYTQEEAMNLIQEAFTAMSRRQNAPALAEEAAFLEENGRRPEVITTESGLQYVVVTEGSGQRPRAESIVSTNYEGRFTDGRIFDSNVGQGGPVEFRVNEVIPGWVEGLQLMNVGSNYTFYVPSELAYGDGGGYFPPFATLIFDVELVEIIEY